MRIHILSDLHLEQTPSEFDAAPSLDLPSPAADVVILAGDIHHDIQGIAWAQQQFADTPVLYVPGNHEFCTGFSMDDTLMLMQSMAQDSSVHLLHRQSLILHGVRFIGVTLWTDFLLHGQAQRQAAQRAAEDIMPELQAVEDFDLHAWQHCHAEDTAFLRQQLAMPFSGRTVVISHHAPHAQSVHPDYARDILTPAFASHLPELVAQADVWIHGHTHHSSDYVTDSGTRIISNPRGYPHEDAPHRPENAAFRPDFVLEV